MEKDLNNLSKEELISRIKQLQKEKKLKRKYGLVWDREKEPERVVELCKNNIPILKSIKSKDIKTDNSQDNILIEGDNYHALQVLNYTHKNKIDVIYIDPPYNTGNKDFKYNDKFVEKEDGYKHSKWLSFINKRISLAQNLLSEKGCMFISIDEHEMAQLMMLCQEIFGEENVEVLVWRKNGKQGNTKKIKRIKNTHEYIIIAYKNKEITEFGKMKILPTWQSTSNPDNDPRGNWMSGNISNDDNRSRTDSPNYYSVTTPSGRVVTREWFITKEEYEKLATDILINAEGKEVSRIYFASDGAGIPRIKRFKNEEQEFYFDSIIDSLGTFSDAKDELIDIFGDRDIFDTPKPSKIIKELIRIASKKDSIVLDFFAGSGTTGHAILELNKEDGGNRKFILCTNNENNICTEVCYPRMSKVINGYKKKGDGEFIEGFGGNLKYFKTELIPIERIDKITDSKRKELTQKAGEIIGIKEDTLQEIEINNYYQILSNNTKTKFTAIYFRESEIKLEELINKIKNKKTVLYVFSYGKVDRKMYKELSKNISIEDIPQPILDIYKELNLNFED